MAKIQRMVLDVLKPHEPPMLDFTQALAELEFVEGVNISLVEVDEKVRNIKITVEGNIDFEEVKEVIQEEGGSIHSVDQVVAGEELVEQINTPQD